MKEPQEFEKHRAGIMMRIDRPTLPPRRCAVTGRFKDDFFIDLGIDIDSLCKDLDRTQIGHLYLSKAACAELAKISGFVPRSEYLAQCSQTMSLISDCKRLMEESAAYKGLLNDVLTIRSDPSADDIAERMRSIDAATQSLKESTDNVEAFGEGTSTERESAESSDEQGLANVRPDRQIDSPSLKLRK